MVRSSLYAWYLRLTFRAQSGIVGAMGNMGGIVFALIFRFQPIPIGKAFWISGVIALVCSTRSCQTRWLTLAQLGNQPTDRHHSRTTGLKRLSRSSVTLRNFYILVYGPIRLCPMMDCTCVVLECCMSVYMSQLERAP